MKKHIHTIHNGRKDYNCEKCKKSFTTREVLKKRPKLYYIGLTDRYFSNAQFLKWIAYAVFHSTMIVFLTLYTVDYTSPNESGMYGGLWVDGTYIFTMLVFIANVKILIASYLITCMAIFWVGASIALYILCLVGISFVYPENDNYGNL